MFSHLFFDCVLWLILLTRSLEEPHTATVGQNAYLACHYSPTTSENLVPVCWGRGPCPTFQCQNTLLSTNGRELNYQSSSRYQLKGNVHKGDVSLTIENVTLADSGTYCCRIQFSGPMNDKKLNLNLDIKPAKVTPAWTPWRPFTTVFPRMFTTEEHGSAETQTLETFHDKNQTQISTLADELQDRISVYIAAGITAGLALVLIFGALILKWYSHRKEKLQNSSLITLANRPPPSGLENTVAEGMHSRENVYTIEENPYELEDPSNDYCYVITPPKVTSVPTPPKVFTSASITPAPTLNLKTETTSSSAVQTTKTQPITPQETSTTSSSLNSSCPTNGNSIVTQPSDCGGKYNETHVSLKQKTQRNTSKLYIGLGIAAMILLIILAAILTKRSLEESLIATVGQNAYLPWHYSSTTSENLGPVCWGREPCSVFECQTMMLRTEGRNLSYQRSSRYQLKGIVHKGDVSLTIENVTLADSGTYCCRIQFSGLMNGKKANLKLDIKLKV